MYYVRWQNHNPLSAYTLQREALGVKEIDDGLCVRHYGIALHRELQGSVPPPVSQLA